MPRTFIIWYQGTIVVELLSCGASVFAWGSLVWGYTDWHPLSGQCSLTSCCLFSALESQEVHLVSAKDVLSLARNSPYVGSIKFTACCSNSICLKVEEYQSLMMELKHKIFWPRSLDLQNFTGLLQIPLSLKLLPWVNYQKSASVEDLDKLNLLTLPSLFYLQSLYFLKWN